MMVSHKGTMTQVRNIHVKGYKATIVVIAVFRNRALICEFNN